MRDIEAEDLRTLMFDDDGSIPNNPHYPVLIYPDAIPDQHSGAWCQARLAENGWGNSWVDGVYGRHHYHSNTHEFLGVVGGEATLQLGGPDGVEVGVSAGDALVLPAGTGHRRITSTGEFSVIGAYPEGARYDMNTGEEEERPEVLEKIESVPVPDTDPLFGPNGPLLQIWG